jgi:hypothetical protein
MADGCRCKQVHSNFIPLLLAQNFINEITRHKMEEHYPHILRRYMGEERDGSYAYYDKATKDAANICGASQGTSRAAKGTEPIGREA